MPSRGQHLISLYGASQTELAARPGFGLRRTEVHYDVAVDKEPDALRRKAHVTESASATRKTFADRPYDKESPKSVHYQDRPPRAIK